MPDNSKHELPDILRGLRERGDGYVSPGEDYFAALAERTARPGPQASVRRLSPARWMAAAAAALLVLLAAWFVLSPEQRNPTLAAGVQPTSEELLAEIDPEAIDDYLSDQLDDLTLELYQEVPLNE